MTNFPEQTSDATSMNKSQSAKSSDNSALLSNSRKEAKLSNDVRDKDDSKSDVFALSKKKAKRLEPISGLLALLPTPLSEQTKELALTLLSRLIEHLHCD